MRGCESWTCFFGADQKITPEILNRQELALIGQAELHITFSYGGPCISFNGVRARFVHKLPHDTHFINRELGSLIKIARFSLASFRSDCEQ
jgi:hypothetical protein